MEEKARPGHFVIRWFATFMVSYLRYIRHNGVGGGGGVYGRFQAISRTLRTCAFCTYLELQRLFRYKGIFDDLNYDRVLL